MDVIKLITDATIKTTGNLLQERGQDMLTLDYEDLALIIRSVLKEKVMGIVQEWEEALAAPLSEGWIRELLKSQALEMGLICANLYLERQTKNG